MTRKLIVALVILCSSAIAQTSAKPEKVCHKFDWNAGYDVPVACKPAKEHPKFSKFKHAVAVTGETIGVVVLAGGLLYVTALSPSGVQVH